MKTFKWFILLILVWGNSVFAATSATDDIQRQEGTLVKSWVAHLNHYFPDLGLQVQPDRELENTLHDLRLLEDYLHGDYSLERGQIELACKKPVCEGMVN